MPRFSNLLPALLAVPLSACGILPDSREPARPSVRAAPMVAGISTAPARSCLADLSRSGAAFAPLPDRMYGAGCSAMNSVRLDRVAGDGDALAVSNLGPLACPLANSFAAWARYGVDRAARQILGSPLVRIETMGSYACRNVAGTTRMSAHSRAEAIDVAAFVLADGRRVSVKGGWIATPSERRFLRTVHVSACKRFGTVLGPDYNAAHHDHLHLELGDGSFCR